MRLPIRAAIFTMIAVSWPNPAVAGTIAPVYGRTGGSFYGYYGGDVSFGSIAWAVTPGAATFDIQINPALSLLEFSFNTTVPSGDFAITSPTGWGDRGLNTSEGIGTDEFDYSIYSGLSSPPNSLSFSVTGSSISQDSDFYRPNVKPDNALWNAILLGAHFEVIAEDASGSIYYMSDIYVPEPAAAVPEPSTLVIWSLMTSVFGVAWIRKQMKAPALAA
ncbi:MAG TPA: PEP-CTERM sorting domain-containing protein [Planctomycetaceae bacterium]